MNEKGRGRRLPACTACRRPAGRAAGGTPTANAGKMPALPVVLLALLLTACSQPAPTNGEVEEHRDQWRPREAQSDFLDIGKQAGIEWLSFVQQDQEKYPEYFDGLDRDQKRRLRLAHTGDGEMILLEFNLPEGSKLWPVDWYGTELMAIDLPDLKGVSLAIATEGGGTLSDVVGKLATNRMESGVDAVPGNTFQSDSGNVWSCWLGTTGSAPASNQRACYAAKSLSYRTGLLRLYAEAMSSDEQSGLPPDFRMQLERLLDSISIKREIALEGSPKHKVSSALNVLLQGTLHYPHGSLSLPVTDELVRKVGGDSTVRIDAHGAEPWLLIRRLKESDLPGDLRVRVRADTTFARRLKQPGAKFSAGYSPGWNFPAVLWDYSYSGGEQIILGVIVVGQELLTLEVISTGLHDSEARRKAKQAALDLFNGANTAPIGDRKPLEPLIGWNIGTMGRDE